MPINKGLGGFCFLKSVKDEIITVFKVDNKFKLEMFTNGKHLTF